MDYYRSLNASALDPDFPTIFELLSCRQLDELIHPSVRYLLVHYAQRHPQYLLKLVNRFDEVFAISFGLIEYYHLKSWNSSFTERFYGLKRTNLLTVSALKTRQATPGIIDEQRRLTKRQVWLSLFSLVAIPYIREKCQARYETLKGRYAFRSMEEDRPVQDAPIKDKAGFVLDQAILKVYPWFVLTENVTAILFSAGYLFHKTTASSVTDWILGFKYSRLSDYDYKRNSPDLETFGWADYLQPKNVGSVTLNLLNYTLPSALFMLKFLEWWNSSDFARKLTQVAPVLRPPAIHQKFGLKGCPICGKTAPETPTVLETGVVFCYKCIFDYLQNGEKEKQPICPVTKKPLLLTTWNKDVDDWQINSLRRLMI